MGLSNAASRARNYDLTINQNQGGGSKKAGFPYIVGRGWRTNIAFGTKEGARNGHCVGLSSLKTLCFTNTVHQSRPIGGNIQTVYFR